MKNRTLMQRTKKYSATLGENRSGPHLWVMHTNSVAKIFWSNANARANLRGYSEGWKLTHVLQL